MAAVSYRNRMGTERRRTFAGLTASSTRLVVEYLSAVSRIIIPRIGTATSCSCNVPQHYGLARY